MAFAAAASSLVATAASAASLPRSFGARNGSEGVSNRVSPADLSLTEAASTHRRRRGVVAATGAFSGLRASPLVPQVNKKLSRVGCVRRSSALLSINSVLNPMDDPILKEAVKEPIAFLGGIFAGLLRLDLNEEPLKDWVAKTAEAAGIDLDESQDFDTDDSIPEDIRID